MSPKMSNRLEMREKDARDEMGTVVPLYKDENMNGKLDTNWLGMPKEGYGFSNDVKALLGAPSFCAASFQYDGGTLLVTSPGKTSLKIQYFFGKNRDIPLYKSPAISKIMMLHKLPKGIETDGRILSSERSRTCFGPYV